MKPGKYIFYNTILLSFFILATTFVNGQTKTIEEKNQFIPEHQKKYNLFDVIEPAALFPQNFLPFNPGEFFQKKYHLPYNFNKTNEFGKVSFNQKTTKLDLPGLGCYQHFNNQIEIQINKKTSIDFGLGLLQQNTTMTALHPIYQLSFRTSVEYSVTNWMDAYIYGQYITAPINGQKNFFDPVLYSNPMFLHTEIGTGLKTNFEKVNANLKFFSIYQNQYKKWSRPNSVISIEF